MVSPANPTAEPELTRLLGSRAEMHIARFPVRPDLAYAERLESYNDALPAVARSFDGLPLDALLMACSGSRYLLGPDEDRDACAELSAETGVPTGSSTLAVREAVEHLGVHDIVLVAPYQPWLTELAERFWKTAGLNVAQVVQVRAREGFSPFDVTPAELVAQVEQAELPGDAVLVFAGTGMATLPALGPLGQGNDRLLLSPNLCGAWWALSRGLGHEVTLSRMPYRQAGAQNGVRAGAGS